MRRATPDAARAVPSGATLARTLLPVAAVGALVVLPGLVILATVSGGTFAYDFLAYHQAAQRVLDGERLYDPSVQVTGGFGLFYYPPPFAVLMVPLGLLEAAPSAWLWLAMSVVMLLAAIAVLPVRPVVRWATLLLAGLSWPVAYALKLGQVGPLLLLLFAIGWRSRNHSARFGLVGAVGTIVKIQPGLVLAWAVLTRRWAAVAVAATVLACAAVVATVAAGGPSIWGDFVMLLRNVSDPITTPHNFTPGAIAFQMGAPVGLAASLQTASSVAVVLAVVVAAVRLQADASLLVAIVASQLLSPVLWDHYALLLLLPVAWLLERGRWWAAVIPLSTSTVLLPLALPAAVVPIGFWVTLGAMLVVGRAESVAGSQPAHATSAATTPEAPGRE